MCTVDCLSSLRLSYPWPNVKPDLSPASEGSPGWPLPENILGTNLTEKTRLVVELGSWLGASARFILLNAPNSIVICVDHWKGSIEHHTESVARKVLPTLYEDFLALNWEQRDRIIPVRENTIDGLRVIAEYGLVPDLIFLDAAHDYESVKADLETAEQLFPTSTIIGDDYLGVVLYEDDKPKDIDYGVRWAVNHFIYDRKWELRCMGRGWQIVRKPSKNGSYLNASADVRCDNGRS